MWLEGAERRGRAPPCDLLRDCAQSPGESKRKSCCPFCDEFASHPETPLSPHPTRGFHPIAPGHTHTHTHTHTHRWVQVPLEEKRQGWIFFPGRRP